MSMFQRLSWRKGRRLFANCLFCSDMDFSLLRRAMWPTDLLLIFTNVAYCRTFNIFCTEFKNDVLYAFSSVHVLKLVDILLTYQSKDPQNVLLIHRRKIWLADPISSISIDRSALYHSQRLMVHERFLRKFKTRP